MKTDQKDSFFYDLHCHTRKSKDAISRLDKIIKKAKERGLTGIAITDHDILYQGETNIDGIQIIPGEEVTLKDRSHLLAYFIKEEIKAETLDLQEAVEEIKRQGGYSSLAHPYRGGEGWVRIKKRTREQIRKAFKTVDAIELGNFKSPPSQKQKLEKTLKSLHINKPLTAGSDAHITGDIAFSVVKTKDRLNKDNFLKAIKESKIIIRSKKDNHKKIVAGFEESLTYLAKKLRIYYSRVARSFFHYIIFHQYLRILNIFRSRVKFNLKEE